MLSAVHLPIKKLGLLYCLNRHTSLYYIEKPVFDKKEEINDIYFKKLSNDFCQFQPKFNSSFTKLTYFGSEEKFISHTGNYQLKQFDWPSLEAKILIDTVPKVNRPDFAGIYGYNDSFIHSGFLADSQFFVF